MFLSNRQDTMQRFNFNSSMSKAYKQQLLELIQLIQRDNQQAINFLDKEFHFFPERLSSPIIQFLITKNKKYLISISAENKIRIWNIPKRIQEDSLIGHISFVTVIAITSDDKYIISGSDDKTIRIWNFKKRSWVTKFEYHSGVITAIDISKDNKYFISASADKSFLIYDLIFLRPYAKGGKFQASITCIKIMNDCDHIVHSCSDNTIHVYSIKKTCEIAVCWDHTDLITNFIFSNNNELIISVSNDNTIRIWNFFTKERVAVLGYKKSISIKFIFITNDDKLLVGVGACGEILTWDLLERTCISECTTYSVGARCIAISSNHKSLAIECGNKYNLIKIWNIDEGIIAVITGHISHVVAMGFIENHILLSCGLDLRIMISNLKNKKQELIVNMPILKAIALSHDCKYLISGWSDKIISGSIFKKKTQKFILEGHKCPIKTIEITNDDKYIVSSDSETVRLWNFQKKSQISLFSIEIFDLIPPRITYDNKFIIASTNKTIVKLNLLNWNEENAWVCEKCNIMSMSVTRSNKYIVTFGALERCVNVWKIY